MKSNLLKIDNPKNKLLSPVSLTSSKKTKKRFWILLILVALISFNFGLLFNEKIMEEKRIIEPITRDSIEIIKVIEKEEAVIQVVEEVSPTVVSIIATKDLPKFISPFERFFDFNE